ncbi:hypothetical protein ACFQZ2_10405 [Streptomonospora algeriensis]|uniref:Uncharacterized protein n=1 Tax=Streptomonospora algeriensis TaxID=995084 RepID=A0ABW3BFH4_9ACTN
MLNLVIGVIVTALEQEVNAERWQEDQDLELAQHRSVMNRLEELTVQVSGLSEQVRGLGGTIGGGEAGPVPDGRAGTEPMAVPSGRDGDSAASAPGVGEAGGRPTA